jgi:nitroimidazol reductase NimA-like FMN-containing flavoprotein (pyridoxamine 5'-phosphate oxidase superfamily)
MDKLAVTHRTKLHRHPERAQPDRAALDTILDQGWVVHVGFNLDGGGAPFVIPTTYVRIDRVLYIHGAVASRVLRAAAADGVDLCATVTLIDGLVLARSAFHHSMNYRSAVVIGQARVVTDPDERQHALALIVDHMIPGRSATLRASTRKELAATAVLAVPLHESSMKARGGGPGDEPEDIEAGLWGGHIPLRRVAGAPVPDEDAVGPVPADVLARSAAL